MWQLISILITEYSEDLLKNSILVAKIGSDRQGQLKKQPKYCLRQLLPFLLTNALTEYKVEENRFV